MGTPASTDTTERTSDLQELGDPEFFAHWSALRQRIISGEKSVSRELKCEYAAVSAEYRRRIDGV